MTSNGYIKLHRKLLNWEWYKDANTTRVFLHLLLIANYGESRYRGVKIHPGQAVIGRRSLSNALGLSEQQVRTALEHLKSTNEITIKSTNKFSVVTVVNWDLYQCDGEESTNKSTNKSTNDQPTSNHTIRNKEDKEDIKRGRPRNKAQELEATYAMMEAWANDEN